ncbi:MAG: tetratricopeptide repeat protein [Phycisphaerae bacterium]|nr:tetratricopeptide repeat protein [Phycisphaerae bacterium]
MLTGPLTAAPPPADHRIPKTQTRRFEIDYRVNEAALPLTSVELWYTRDNGETWHNYGMDQDRQSPITFDATEEGLYGFHFVLENAIGVSGERPQPSTVPQQWVFVDYTPPIVQLHPVQMGRRDAPRQRVQVRWTAIDANFGPRPIELSYRLVPDGQWARIADHLSNTGRYDWCPDEHMEGLLVVRLTAHDRSNHRVSAVSRAVELVKPPASQKAGSLTNPGGVGDPSPAGVDLPARQRARALYQRGLMHKERGEHRLAAARFQDALAIDELMPEALVNLGETLYFQKEYEDSIEAYKLVIGLEPTWAEARRGLVRVLMVVDRYDDASAQLAHILSDAPQNAEAWLTLGDVAMSQGDELMARENWQKAATVDPAAKTIMERAQARLATLRRTTILAGSSRN